MRYCPNEECPHRRLTGRPAELIDGTTSCPECGEELVDQAPSSSTEALPDVSAFPKPLRNRLLLTGATLAGIWLLHLLPSPFIRSNQLFDQLGFSGFQLSNSLGPLSLGLTPFIIAFVLVEIAVLLFRNRARHDSPSTRRKMTGAALALGVVIGAVQAYGLALWLEDISYTLPPHTLLFQPGIGFRLLVTLTLLIGSAVWVAAALLINRRGVGNGFALLILASLAPLAIDSLRHFWRGISIGEVTPISALLLVISVLAMFYGVARFFLRFGVDRSRALPIAYPTCGVIPIEIGVSAVLLPATLNNLFELRQLEALVEALYPGGELTLLVEVILIAATVPVASALFYRRHRDQLRAPTERDQWRRAQLFSGGFLILCVLTIALATHLFGPGAAALLPSSLTLIAVVVISLDLREELILRRRCADDGDLILLEEHQDVGDAIEALREYDESNRGVVVQGLYFRSMAYFFGPYVPLRVYGQREPERPSDVVVDPTNDAVPAP